MRYVTKIALFFAVVLFGVESYAFDGSDVDRIRSYDYNFLELRGPNAKSVLAHAAASASFCERIVGPDKETSRALSDLASPLKDQQPDVTKKVQALGDAGFFGDSTGLVPLASIKEITQIKGINESAFCVGYIAGLKREVARYRAKCQISNDLKQYKCNFN